MVKSLSLLEEFNNNNFLITTDAWFVAPDGKQYKAAWGKVSIKNDKQTIGITTNTHSTNWYAIVGEIGIGKSIVIAGCQIKYACVCEDKPNTKSYKLLKTSDELGIEYSYTVENMIYLAQ